VGKSEGKRPLGRPRCRWEDNIKMDLHEVEIRDMDWIGLAQDRKGHVVGTRSGITLTPRLVTQSFTGSKALITKNILLKQKKTESRITHQRNKEKDISILHILPTLVNLQRDDQVHPDD
jgi:hypothetical protein